MIGTCEQKVFNDPCIGSVAREKSAWPPGGVELFLPMPLPVPPTQKAQLLRGLFVLEDVHETRQKFVPSSRYAPIGATT